MSIGKQIELARVEKGYSQKELAKLCGWSQQVQSVYERDGSTPTDGRLDKIAEVLGKEWKLQ